MLSVGESPSATPVSETVIVEIKSFSFYYTQTGATIYTKISRHAQRAVPRAQFPHEGQAPADQATTQTRRAPRRARPAPRRGRRRDEDARGRHGLAPQGSG